METEIAEKSEPRRAAEGVSNPPAEDAALQRWWLSGANLADANSSLYGPLSNTLDGVVCPVFVSRYGAPWITMPARIKSAAFLKAGAPSFFSPPKAAFLPPPTTLSVSSLDLSASDRLSPGDFANKRH